MNKFKNIVISKKDALRQLMEYLKFEDFKYDIESVYVLEKDQLYYPNKKVQYKDMNDESYDRITNKLYRIIEAQVLAQEEASERKRIENKVLIITGLLKN